MQIFALFDDQGFPKGFYTPFVHGTIPNGAVGISVKQWHEFIRHKGLRRWDGDNVVEYFPDTCSRPDKFLLMGRFFLLSRLLSEKIRIMTS